MVVVQRLGVRRVGAGLLAWAILVDVCLFLAWTSGSAGIPSDAHYPSYLVAGLLTIAAGFWVGWRRRVGAAFGAPVLAWMLLVPFAFASGFLTHGFLGGLWHGIVLSVVGGIVTSFVEGVFLLAFSVLGRLAVASSGRGRRGVSILPPGFR